MRFMMFMIPKVYQPDTPVSERAGDGFAPPADAVEQMMKYNEELAKAGALIALDGLCNRRILPPTLASLRGKPVLLFIWAEGCGDCKAQSATLARAKSRFENKGLQLVTLTRYYEGENEPEPPRQKAKMDSVWKAVYADIGTVPIVISTASMEHYGGSSTPTFVFIDREGIVRRYTPTRLTEEELDRELEKLMR